MYYVSHDAYKAAKFQVISFNNLIDIPDFPLSIYALCVTYALQLFTYQTYLKNDGRAVKTTLYNFKR